MYEVIGKRYKRNHTRGEGRSLLLPRVVLLHEWSFESTGAYGIEIVLLLETTPRRGVMYHGMCIKASARQAGTHMDGRQLGKFRKVICRECGWSCTRQHQEDV